MWGSVGIGAGVNPEDPHPTRDLPRSSGSDKTSDPIEAFREPDNRIKLLLAIGVLSLLNLLLVAFVLMQVRDTHEIVEVEGQRCIVIDEDEAAALYCRR